ncbi:flagellar basal body-associated FliL family protein [Pontibacterium sp.]|uniref:flagellar basal body-associated FliL family protein n=1 Tax=Pontibacterium sp. TaxID=2036026 RepID=UPI0035629CE3
MQHSDDWQEQVILSATAELSEWIAGRETLKQLFLVLVLGLFMQTAWAADEEAAPEDYVNYIELKPFLTNYGEPGKVSFVKCEITIQVSSPAAHHAVNFHMPHIRNDIVFLLSDQTESQMMSVEAQSDLAKKALKLVQNILVEEEGEAFVSDLFFTSFITQ